MSTENSGEAPVIDMRETWEAPVIERIRVAEAALTYLPGDDGSGAFTGGS